MSQLTLEDVKLHCQAFDYVEDDTLLRDYLEAAEAHVQDHVRRDLDTEFPDVWPQPCVQAVKMLVAHWYLNREATATAGISLMPLGVRDLLAPYRNLAN